MNTRVKQVIPFFRFQFDPDALRGIEDSLQSGWLTTGPKTKEFESAFVRGLGNEQLHAVSLNSCTAALHLALEAIGLQRHDRVIVPTMTFAATAEVVRYFDAIPVMCDVDNWTLCMTTDFLRQAFQKNEGGKIKAVIPVHYGGRPCDIGGIVEVANEFGAVVIEDAAHAFPAGWKSEESRQHSETEVGSAEQDAALSDHSFSHRMVGNNTSRVTCFSFYANKTITTGEGGMAVTADAELAERMRLMSLHGMNRDAWKRFSADGTWDYQLVAPGFKYNMTDIAAAIGLSQLKKAESFRRSRERIANLYDAEFSGVDEIEIMPRDPRLLHSHHLYVIRLRLETLRIDRAMFIEAMKDRGVMCSVHWRPLHMHPYYIETYGYRTEDFPISASLWPRIVSLPIYPGLSTDEAKYVADTVRGILKIYRL